FMSYLFILKRFEIWLLLGIVVALLVFAFQPIEEPASGELGEPARFVETTQKLVLESEEGKGSVAKPEALTVQKVSVEPTEEGQVVEVTLLAQFEADELVEVNDKTLMASTDAGVPVPHFFAPFLSKQSVGPGEPSLVTVRFWLAGSAESIWLDFQGERAKAELPSGS
ncbi:MAG: hypothetical protein AAF357_10325, partial [Verrucomicrobiota bacterium]